MSPRLRHWVWLKALLIVAIVCFAKMAFAAGDSGSEEEGPRMSPIVWFLWTSGYIGAFIGGLSIYFTALIIRLFMELKLDVAMPPDIAGRVQDLVKNRDFQGAYDLARSSDTFFGRVLSIGIAELPNGLGDAREAMDRAGEAERVDMERKISMLAVIGTLGPMIGLVGTLKGMIASFGQIAMGGQQLKADKVAEGISEALLLTFEGVFLSIPAIFFFAFFRNRVANISVNVMLEADHTLRFFYRTGQSRGGAAQRPAPAPASR